MPPKLSISDLMDMIARVTLYRLFFILPQCILSFVFFCFFVRLFQTYITTSSSKKKKKKKKIHPRTKPNYASNKKNYKKTLYPLFASTSRSL